MAGAGGAHHAAVDEGEAHGAAALCAHVERRSAERAGRKRGAQPREGERFEEVGRHHELARVVACDLERAEGDVRRFEKPLACYIFSEDKQVQHRVITELQFGGATINDVVIHLANNHMGFGGVGNSGMGAYHGKAGFDCFTHYKSTLRKGTWLELPVRVPPFSDLKMKIVKLMMG